MKPQTNVVRYGDELFSFLKGIFVVESQCSRSGNSPFFVCMDRKSKLIFWIFFISVAFVTTALFSKFYILRDYTLKAEVECDPQSEVCFERPCLEECEPDAEPEYYKIQTVQASDVLLCDPHLGECPEIDCGAIASCSEEFCSDESVPEGESCTHPEDFMVPAEEEVMDVVDESSEVDEDFEAAEIVE
jgi:hypothetical protein